MAGRVRKGRAKFLGFNALVLTTVGRKTGAERTTPVGWFPGPDGSWLVVASAGGAMRSPDWYYNIAAHPDQVQVDVEGRKVAVTAEQLHGAEREQAWQQITTAVPRFTQYQVKTDRELPIIHLVPRSGGAGPRA
jgi:deazaflavin-dependent oxidoreductase (nitroreductase family)